MNRTLQMVLVGMWTIAMAGTAAALPPPSDDPPPEDPTPPPPPPSQAFSYSAQSNGSIGNSTLGASYQASLSAWADSTRQNLSARGYAWSEATLLGKKQNLVIVNGLVTAGTSYGTEVSAYVLGAQVTYAKDSFPSSFSKTFSTSQTRQFWSYTNSWTFLGTGVTIRLGVDGGFSLNGYASGAPLRVTGQLNPRVWVDAGGALSFQVFWMNAGSLSGSIHLVDAQGSGTAAVDASAVPSGGQTQWTVAGSARLCSGGGAITGCIAGSCGTLASWSNFCPGWASLSGSASGSI